MSHLVELNEFDELVETAPGRRFIPDSVVCTRHGYSTATLRRLRKSDPTFPRGIKFSSGPKARNFTDLRDLVRWERAKLAEALAASVEAPSVEVADDRVERGADGRAAKRALKIERTETPAHWNDDELIE